MIKKKHCKMDYKRLENIKDKNEEQLEDNEANKLLSEFKKNR